MNGAALRETGAIEEDSFLTGALGIRVGRIVPDRLSVSDDRLPRELRGFDLVWSKISTDDPTTVTRLIRVGFELVATELQFELPLRRRTTLDSRPGRSVRAATQDDKADVIRIAAQSFSEDRFHRDPRIDGSAADAVKGLWAGNFFSGARGDRMFVVEDSAGAVAGFVQLLDRDSATIIDLVAVARGAQGRGIGAALVNAAIESAGPQAARVVVGTQITNTASLRLYSRSGFSLVSSRHVLHHHRAHGEVMG